MSTRSDHFPRAMAILVVCLFGLQPLSADAQKINRDSLFGRAVELQHRGKETDAAAVFTEILAARPKDTLSYFYRGNSLRKQGKYDSAIQDYKKVLQLYSDYTPGSIALARAQDDAGQTADALKTLKKAIRKDVDNWESYFGRGEILLSHDQLTEAAFNFDKAIEYAPASIDAYSQRAVVNYRQGLWHGAVQDYNKVIALDASAKEAFNAKGILEIQLGLFNEAEKDFSVAINLDPQNAVAYNNRGLAMNSLGRYDNAIADLKKAIDLDGADGYPVVNIISPLVRTRRYSEAIAYFDKLTSQQLASFVTDRSWKFYNSFIHALQMLAGGASTRQVLDTLRAAKSYYRSEGPQGLQKAVQTRAFSDVLAVEGGILSGDKKFNSAIKVYKQALVFSPEQPDVKAALDSIGGIFNNRPFTIKFLTLASDTLVIHSPPDTITILAKIDGVDTIQDFTINDSIHISVGANHKFQFDFVPHIGVNELQMSFRDESGNFYSTTHHVVAGVNGDGALKFGSSALDDYDQNPPRYRAILIAEQTYADSLHWPALHTPIGNARNFYNLLVGQYDFLPKDIDTLYNRSRNEILTILAKVAGESKNISEGYDNLLIFYSGHGTAQIVNSSRAIGYIIPSNATADTTASYISSGDIDNALATCEARHVLIMADACYSGALLRSTTGGAPLGGLALANVGPDAPVLANGLYNLRSRKIFTSGSLKPSPDQSVFFSTVFGHLTRNPEKYYPALLLFTDMVREVYLQATDIPQYRPFDSNVDQNGEFIFLRPNGTVPR